MKDLVSIHAGFFLIRSHSQCPNMYYLTANKEPKGFPEWPFIYSNILIYLLHNTSIHSLTIDTLGDPKLILQPRGLWLT